MIVSDYLLIIQRFPIGFQAVFAIISGTGLLLLPDTPRWYYARERYEEADAILARLWDRDINEAEVQQMKTDIMVTLRLEEQGDAKIQLEIFILGHDVYESWSAHSDHLLTYDSTTNDG